VEDRTDPARAYETFRWLVFQGEHEREFECLSDPLRARFGMSSRHDWQDARVTVLAQDSRFVRAIVRSRVVGDAIPEDGRARLKIRVRVLFFRFTGHVWMRPIPVVRIYLEGQERPFYEYLPGLVLVPGKGSLGVRVPAGFREEVEAAARERGGRVDRFEARIEWFLDDFAMGDETPDRVKDSVEKSREETQ